MSASGGFEYSCDYCRVSFDRDIHIQCAECRDIRLCLTCFSYGKELPPHKNNHAYYIVEYVRKPIFNNNKSNKKNKNGKKNKKNKNNTNEDKNYITWSGHEDILLLDGIEKYGLGNWKKISQHIGNNKTSKQTELHYLQIYCNDSSDSSDLDDLDADEYDSDIIDISSNNKNSNNKKNKSNNKIKLDGYCDPRSYIASTRLIHRYVNYYPYRHEFDSEYQELGELLISDLTGHDLINISNKDINIISNISQYDSILKIRNQIKDFILDRKLMLLHNNVIKNSKNKIQTNTKLLLEKYQPICKYFKSTKEYINFLETNALIKSERHRIEQYVEYRKAGCRTMEDIAMRQKMLEQQSHKNRYGPNRYGIYSNNGKNKKKGRKGRRKGRYNLQIIDDSDSDNEYNLFDCEPDLKKHKKNNHNNTYNTSSFTQSSSINKINNKDYKLNKKFMEQMKKSKS
eukprot:502921_1